MTTTKKPRFVAIDIETRNLNAEQIEFEAQFIKHRPGTKDETKKTAQIETKKRGLFDRGALTDSSEIACIGFFIDGYNPHVLHTFGSDIADEDTTGLETEEEILYMLSQTLNKCCGDETEIVVANAGFDLPKIRYGCIRNAVTIPNVLKPKAPNSVYDVLSMAGKYFFTGSTPYSISLDDLVKRFKISFQGKIIPGSEIPGMIDSGQWNEVIEYNRTDVLMTGFAYMLMTGQMGLPDTPNSSFLA